jgi:hypothetical protein
MTSTHDDFTIVNGWALKASARARADAHIKMTLCMAGHDRDQWQNPTPDDATCYIPAIIADLVARAFQLGMSREEILASMFEELGDDDRATWRGDDADELGNEEEQAEAAEPEGD